VYFLFFIARGRGGGDVKLMGAYGALLGPLNWFVLFVLTAVFGGVVALIVVLAKGRVKQTWLNIMNIAGKNRVTLDSQNAFSLPHGAVAAVPALLMAWALGVK
jgi:prepilin peptidase CpaA